MITKITQKILAFVFTFAVCMFSNAQEIYTNGSLSTGAFSNSAEEAPTGYTWSELQNDTSNDTISNGALGFTLHYGNPSTLDQMVADDFVVPDGQVWNIGSFDFFVYQTGYTGSTLPFDALRIQILNTEPTTETPGTPIFGNMTTNVINVVASEEAMMYRIRNSAVPSPGTPVATTRKIWKVRGNLTATLPAGTYWVVYQLHATNNGNIASPTVTVSGTRGLEEWNAKHCLINNGIPTWDSINDNGEGTDAESVPQDLPFIINEPVLGTNQNGFDAKISISPNPVKNILHVSTAKESAINSYEIYDVYGKRIVTKDAVNSNSVAIDVADLSVGNYILTLKSSQGTTSKKFLKE